MTMPALFQGPFTALVPDLIMNTVCQWMIGPTWTSASIADSDSDFVQDDIGGCQWAMVEGGHWHGFLQVG